MWWWNKVPRCSFCGKLHSEVKYLIEGPRVYICDKCVMICKEALDKRSAADAKEPKHSS